MNIPDVKIKRPKTPAARTRRRQAGELDRILQSSERSRSKNLKPAILLAIENRTSIYRWLKAACGRRKGNARWPRGGPAKLTARQQAQVLRWINGKGRAVGWYISGSAACRGNPADTGQLRGRQVQHSIYQCHRYCQHPAGHCDHVGRGPDFAF
ncbi:hypothetical protein [Cupriavidus basilensis]